MINEVMRVVVSFAVGFLSCSWLVEWERRKRDRSNWKAMNRRSSDFLKLKVR